MSLGIAKSADNIKCPLKYKLVIFVRNLIKCHPDTCYGQNYLKKNNKKTRQISTRHVRQIIKNGSKDTQVMPV